MKKLKKNVIWIAEDDADDRLMLKEAFEESGYKKPLLFFEDGELVLNLLKNKKAKDSLPSLIVLDLNMPKVNGQEVLSYLKSNMETNNIPVIIFTTSRSEEDKQTFLKLGASAYITKPYKFQEMVEIAGGLVKSYG